MQTLWILAAMIYAPSGGGEKVIDPNAVPMGPALERGAPEVQHTVKNVKLPPLPEHPEPPPGTSVAHIHGAGGPLDPVFPATPTGDGPPIALKAAGAALLLGLLALLGWTLRRRACA